MEPWLNDGDVQLFHGDVRTVLDQLPEGIAQTCVTSPPYWGLRDYGVAGQIGLEPTFDEFLEGMVDVFRAVRRVLAVDGTVWVNMGDSYAQDGKWGGASSSRNADRAGAYPRGRKTSGLKPKDLVGQPWRLAFALQEDGWYLRSDIVWRKPNAMPESVADRPSRDHEYLFLLAREPRYYYDQDAIREPYAAESVSRLRYAGAVTGDRLKQHAPDSYVRLDGAGRVYAPNPKGRSKRTVWDVAASRFAGAHFATFPPELIEPCVLAGSRPGDIVLDPFMGSGTTAAVARAHGRRAVGVELNEAYLALAADRLAQQSLLAGGAA
jgi:DNA modification methylase